MPARRVIVYGLGSVGRRAARIAHQKGAEIVAVYVRSPSTKDFSGEDLARAQVCTPEVPFDSFAADVLVMTHASRIPDIHPVALRAARAGLNVVSVSNEGYDPFAPRPTWATWRSWTPPSARRASPSWPAAFRMPSGIASRWG